MKVIDLRKAGNHPCILKYTEIYDAAVLQCRVAHIRSQPGISLKGMSPFVVSAKRAVLFGLERNGVLEVLKDTFRTYYDSVQAETAAQWFGINVNEDTILNAVPPWGAVFPWRARSIESYRNAFEEAALFENKTVGMVGGIEMGWLFNGPVTDFKIDVESERMLHVLRQIDQYGYKRHNGKDGDARATALVDEEFNWRLVLTGGNHRASAASALGYTHIPIRVNLVIKREEVDYWPHVLDRIYTREQALKVFDSYFFARPGLDVKKWFRIAKRFKNDREER